MHVSKAREAQKPGEDPTPAKLYKSSYYFMGRRLPKIKPGATVEEGETLGYANSVLDSESDRDENQNFQLMNKLQSGTKYILDLVDACNHSQGTRRRLP